MGKCINGKCCGPGTIYDDSVPGCIVNQDNDLEDMKASSLISRKLNEIRTYCQNQCKDINNMSERKICKKDCKKEQYKVRDINGYELDGIEVLDKSNEDMQESREFSEKSSELLDIWRDSKEILRTAPEEEILAKQNFLIHKLGEEGYNQRLLKRFTKEGDRLRRKLGEEHRELIKELKTWLATYESQTKYIKRMNQLYKLKVDENKKYKNFLKNEISSTLTNDRRVTYEEHQFKSLHTFRTIMKYIYFGLLVVIIIFGKFFQNALYKQPKIWIGIILYIIFPFILPFIPIGIFYIINKIKYLLENKAPRNIYTDL